MIPYLPAMACGFGCLGTPIILICAQMVPEHKGRTVAVWVVFGTMIPLLACCTGAAFTGRVWFGATFGTLYFLLVCATGSWGNDPSKKGHCTVALLSYLALPFVYLLHPSVTL